MDLGRNSTLIALILQAEDVRLQYRLHLTALNIASHSYSAYQSVYILPSDVFVCILSFCPLVQVLVVVMLHPLTVSANSKQGDPDSGADQSMCIILMPE